MAIRAGGQLAVKLAQTAGAFASGRAYVQRYFPPGYREPATKLITAFEQAALGAGLYQVYNNFINNDGAEQGDAFPPKIRKIPSKFNKTRPGRGRSGYRRNRYSRSNRCRCPKRRYRNVQARRY